MPSPFDTWSADDAKKALGNRSIPTAHGAFFRGDHWQNGDGWSGPRLDASDDEGAFVMREIERAFVSQNAIKEVVERAAGGVTARAVAWNLVPRRRLAEGETPTKAEQQLAQEAESVLSEWIDARDAEGVLRKATHTMLWAGRGPMRLFVPAGELTDGRVPPGDLLESIERIYLHEDLDPEQAGVVRDSRTQKEAAVHVYQDDDNREVIELAYIDDAGNTILRVMGQGDQEGAWTFPLGKRLPIFEMKRDPLITDQMVSQQKLLNLALTMMQRNVILGGFLERVFLNAQLPGHYETDAQTGKRTFVPEPWRVGAGAVNTLIGVRYTDAQGAEQLANPSVVYRDPVSVDTFRQTKEEAYMSILAEAHQLHYAMAGDAVASGESRKTAMADYIVDLLLTKAQVERAWAWMLETALTMAAVFAGQPGRFDSLRVTAQAQLDAGPISTEMMRVILEWVREELLSRRLAMSWGGVDDVEAELARIAEEREERGAQPQGAADEIESLFASATAQENQQAGQNGAQAEQEAALEQ